MSDNSTLSQISFLHNINRYEKYTKIINYLSSIQLNNSQCLELTEKPNEYLLSKNRGKSKYMDLEVEPKNWILPNRVAYNKYIYNTFNPSKYPLKQAKKQSCACSNDVCDIPSTAVSLFPQQRMVRDMIQVDSTYRGILLYHELGSGKSAASIAAAEGYVGRKKVFVLSPASLAQNYENEIMKVSALGLNLKKSWTQLKITRDVETLKALYDKYAISAKFVKKDDPNLLKRFKVKQQFLKGESINLFSFIYI